MTSARLTSGSAGIGKPLGHLAEQRHTALVEVKHPRRDDAADHDEQRHGPMLQDALAEQQERQRGQPERERREIGLAEAPHEMAHALPEVRRDRR